MTKVAKYNVGMGNHDKYKEFDSEYSLAKYLPQEFHKSSFGMEDLLSTLSSAFAVMQKADHTSYPPYNIVRVADNEYVIEMAIAGFTSSEIEVKTGSHILTITGEGSPVAEKEYIYKGISSRKFVRTFQLTEHVIVSKVEMKDGMLCVYLEKNLPEPLQPKVIPITDC